MTAEDDGGRVIPWPGTVPAEDGFPITREQRTWACRHMRVTLIEQSHTVICADCEATLDAWAVLHQWTVEWEYLAARYEQVRRDITTATTRLDSMLRREKNARARLRRVLGKASPAERVLDAARAYLDAWDDRDSGRLHEALLAMRTAVDSIEVTP